MKKLKRELIVKVFYENTSIHGVRYLNEKNKPIKVTWGFIVLVSALLIILSTALLVQQYLKYDDYIITKEYDVDKLEEIPNMVVCSSQQLAMVDSIANFNLTNTNLSMNSLIDQFNKEHLDLEECVINIRSKVVNCMNFKREIIFTFNGFCLFIDFQELKQNGSLLFKQFDQFQNFETYKVNISMKFKMNEDRLYFKLFPNTSSVHSQLNSQLIIDDNLMLNQYSKEYDVTLEYASYTSSLQNIKCFHHSKNYLASLKYYDEYLCEFECLKRMIKQILVCDFSFNSFESTDCTVGKLVQIEQIVKNYTSIKNDLKICKTCLPSCESIRFNLKEIHDFIYSDGIVKYGKVLKLYFNFKKIEKIHILNLESSELLNFVNGLWSFFLGISVLSIWEIIEFIYALSNHKFSVNNKSFSLEENKIFQKLKSGLFIGSYFHGFNFIFLTKSSNSFKFRWIIIVSLATVGFFIATSNAIRDYQQYMSDVKKEIVPISSDQRYRERNLTIIACMPLEFKDESKKKIFNQLDIIASDLFQLNIFNMNVLISQYSQHFLDKEFKIEDIDEYEKVFKNSSNLLALFSSKMNLIEYETSEIFYDKQCAWFNTGLKAYDFINAGTRFFVKMSVNTISYDIFLLDSGSLHLSPSSKMARSYNKFRSFTTANLKYMKLLSDPYKPSCVERKGYKQHECYQVCFNDIIKKTFGCSVIFGGFIESSSDCSPWMLPLINIYEKYVLKNLQSDECSHCKEPCEYYYYDVEIDYSYKYRFSNFEMSEVSERTEQFNIVTRENTIIIVISYISLFYGGSILAIIQLFFNAVTNTTLLKKRFSNIEINFLKKMKILDLFSKLNTIHCSKYISPKNKNDFKKLFWILVLTSTLIFSILMSMFEIKKYTNAVNVSKTIVSKDKEIDWPKINLCRSIEDPSEYLRQKLDIISFSDFRYLNEKIKKIKLLNNSFINKESLLKSLLNEKHSLFVSYEHYPELFQMKWSNLIDDLLNSSYFGLTEISNGMNWERNRVNRLINSTSSMKIYQTGALYDDWDAIRLSFNTDYCEEVNVHNNIEVNPFINTQMNQLNVLYLEKESFSEKYNIYLDSSNLPSAIYSKEGHGEFFRIKSMYKNYDYKYSCKNKEECVFNKKMLRQYSENELFLCNNELKEAIYNAFNCTPFINTTARIPECSIPYSMFISEVMLKYKKELFKCEISTAEFPIEYESLLSPLKDQDENALFGIDMNNFQVYEQNIKQDYGWLKLIMNLSNFLNVILGFSFITICELLFISFNHCFTTNFEKASLVYKHKK